MESPTVPKFVLINELSFSPDDIDEVLNEFDELGYPIRSHIDL